MDIDTNLVEQLNALSGYLRRVASNKDPVSKEMWAIEIVEGMIEHADFLDRYTTPKVVRLLNGEKLTVRGPVPANGIKVAELVRATELPELHEEESSVGPVVPAPNGADGGGFLPPRR